MDATRIAQVVDLFLLHNAAGLTEAEFDAAKRAVGAEGASAAPPTAEEKGLMSVTRHVYEAGRKTNRSLIASEVVRVDPAASVAEAWDVLRGKKPPASGSDVGHLYVLPPGMEAPRQLPPSVEGHGIEGAESWEEEAPQYGGWSSGFKKIRGFSEKAERTTCGELFGNGAQLCMIYSQVADD